MINVVVWQLSVFLSCWCYWYAVSFEKFYKDKIQKTGVQGPLFIYCVDNVNLLKNYIGAWRSKVDWKTARIVLGLGMFGEYQLINMAGLIKNKQIKQIF